MRSSNNKKQNPRIVKAIEFFGSPASLAKALGVPNQYVYHWQYVYKKIPVNVAFKIHELTDGVIKFYDLIPECVTDEFISKYLSDV